MAVLSDDELLWSEFEDELGALIEATKAADKSYVEARGMSLASVVVGSAATRLSKVMSDDEPGKYGARTRCIDLTSSMMCRTRKIPGTSSS